MGTFAITGIATGIGAELVQILRKDGHQVIGFDIAEPKKDLDMFCQVDLADSQAILAAAALIDGQIDGLCNNAGLPPRYGLEEKILQVNFLSQRRFTQAVLPHLKRGASIVNMASRAGHGWREGVQQVKRLSRVSDQTELARFVEAESIDPIRAYNLSKEAMILWTAAEAEAMIPLGIRVNSLSPGAIATRILDDFSRAFGDRMAKNIARAGRPGEAIEVARAAAFLLAPDSSWINGTDIAIDGGMGSFAISDGLELGELRVLALP